jgi:uncharacterized protein with HEPN domain
VRRCVPSSDPVQRFTDIIENICHIERFTRGLDATAFAENDQAFFALRYALMIISAAATKLGDTGAALQPNIPWREIRGLGNRLRHAYDSIDLTRIRLLIERDLLPLKAASQDALLTPSQRGSPRSPVSSGGSR